LCSSLPLSLLAGLAGGLALDRSGQSLKHYLASGIEGFKAKGLSGPWHRAIAIL
jgi:hypothetical protein